MEQENTAVDVETIEEDLPSGFEPPVKYDKKYSSNKYIEAVKLIPIERIVDNVKDRYLTNFENERSFKALKESLLNVGLINPILVQKKNDDYVLLCGRRRVRAFRDLANLKKKEFEKIKAQILVEDTPSWMVTSLIFTDNQLRRSLAGFEKSMAFIVALYNYMEEKDGALVEDYSINEILVDIISNSYNRWLAIADGDFELAALSKQELNEFCKKMNCSLGSLRKDIQIFLRYPLAVYMTIFNFNGYGILEFQKIPLEFFDKGIVRTTNQIINNVIESLGAEQPGSLSILANGIFTHNNSWLKDVFNYDDESHVLEVCGEHIDIESFRNKVQQKANDKRDSATESDDLDEAENSALWNIYAVLALMIDQLLYNGKRKRSQDEAKAVTSKITNSFKNLSLEQLREVERFIKSLSN